MNKKYMLIIVLSSLLLGCNTNKQCEYHTTSISSLISSVDSVTTEKAFKEWLQLKRPIMYKKMYDKKVEDKEDEGIISGLLNLQEAIETPQMAFLDFYINKKAEEGWIVVTSNQRFIIFKKYK